MRKSQVTIKDIAKKLNISPSTVSRALRDHPDISAAFNTEKCLLKLNHKLRHWNSLCKIRDSVSVMQFSIKSSNMKAMLLIITDAISLIFNLFITYYQYNSKPCKFQIDGFVSHWDSAGATPACHIETPLAHSDAE